MISIHPLKSYRLIDAHKPVINHCLPLKDRLRSAHKNALQLLIRLLKKEVAKLQRFGGTGHRGGMLHKVRTNRKQLAKMLDVCEKTAYNLLQRLEDLQCIKKHFHGSNASFEVEINPSLLHVEDDTLTQPINVSLRFSSALPPLRQTLPHTLPRVPWDTKESNKGEGLPADDAGAATPPAPASSADNPERQDTGSGYLPHSADPRQPEQDTEVAANATKITDLPAGGKNQEIARRAKRQPVITTPKRWKRPAVATLPATLPKTMDEVLALVEPKNRVRLTQRVDHVFEYALGELQQWFPSWLAPSVRERARIALAEYYAYASPRSWNDATIQFADRIDLVDQYLEGNFQKGQDAWLPLPHLYFDIRTPKAFGATKSWRKGEHFAEEWNKEAVQRAMKDYWRALDSKRINEDDTLLKIKQTLEKKGGHALFARFQNQFSIASAARGVA